MLGKIKYIIILVFSFATILFYFTTAYGNIKEIYFNNLTTNSNYEKNLLSTDSYSSNISTENLKLNWKYYETDNLKIIYPDYLYNFSLYISEIAEDVYSYLSQITNFHPDKKVIILISPKGDSPNGYVTLGPRGLYVTIYAVHPYEAISYGLDSYREWYKTLISHEFAHIFHIGERRKISKLMSGVFGQIVFPNGLTPIFYREGYAVNFETLYNKQVGRANSNYTKMYLRSVFKETPDGGYIWIDRFSSRPRIWPYTNGCYLYGASFLYYLRKTYSKNILSRINNNSSNFYYFSWINSFKRETGKNVDTLWHEWLKNESLKQESEIKKIREYKLTNFKKISFTKGYVFSISLSSTGRYACYCIDSGDKSSGLYIYDFKMRTNKLIKPDLICQNAFFDEDNNGIFYIRENYKRDDGWIKSLYYLDLKEKKEYRITNSDHTLDFTFYDNNRLLLIKSAKNMDRIYLAKLDRYPDNISKKTLMKIVMEKEILNPLNNYIIESPSFSPDRSQIAFSVKDLNNDRFIVFCNVKKVKNRIIISNPRLISGIDGLSYFPKWVNNRFLTFINDSNGVYNIYLTDIMSKKYYRVTNLITGVLDYDISKYGDIIGKIYSSKGFFVGYWNLSDQKNRSFYSQGRFKVFETQLPKTEKQFIVRKEIFPKPKSYKPIKYLFPSYWLPFALGNGINFGVGLFTMNRDYLGRFDYSFAIVYDILDNMFKLSLTGVYNLSSFKLFGNNLLCTSTYNNYNDNGSNYVRIQGYSFYYGVEDEVIKYNYVVLGKVGALRELPFAGIRFTAVYSNARLNYQWNLPYDGITAKNDLYLELNNGKWILNKSTIDLYFPLFYNSVFNFGGEILSDFGTDSGYVYLGSGLNFLYAPVNGIISSGYSDISKGDVALKENISLNLPLFQIERGLGVFPFYLNNLYGAIGINFYEIFYIKRVTGSDCGLKDFFNGEDECLRFSMNFSLNFNTTIFYDFPAVFKFGYILAPMKGGDNRIYISFTQSMN